MITRGGYDPVDVLNTWPIWEVHRTAFYLSVSAALEVM